MRKLLLMVTAARWIIFPRRFGVMLNFFHANKQPSSITYHY